jgi:hypothetical protein
MGITRKHGLYGVELGEVAPVVIGGITRQSIAMQSIVQSEARSGEVYARLQALTEQRPRLTFTTNAVAAALDKAALVGLDISTLSTGLHLIAQKHADGGTRTAGATHRKYTLNDGLLFPTRLTCQHGGDAELEYEVIATYDGSNDPIVIADSQALPSGLDDAERFTLGSMTIESVTFDHLRSFELDFGLRVEAEGSDSDIWPTIVTIIEILPVIRLRGVDIEWAKAANVPLIGLAATHTNTAIYLRKRADGGTFVADATAEHIKFTAAGYATIETVFDAQGNETGETELVMPLVYDGTNDPLVIDTTSVLP